jgi:hypothetical protein
VTVALVGGLVAALIWSSLDSMKPIHCTVQLGINGVRVSNAQMTFYVDLEAKAVKGPDRKYPMMITDERIAWSFTAPAESGGTTAEEVTITRPHGNLVFLQTTSPTNSPPRSSRGTGTCTGVPAK